MSQAESALAETQVAVDRSLNISELEASDTGSFEQESVHSDNYNDLTHLSTASSQSQHDFHYELTRSLQGHYEGLKSSGSEDEGQDKVTGLSNNSQDNDEVGIVLLLLLILLK